MFEIIEYAVDVMVEPSITFVFAAAMALAVFSYLYTAKNANMIHALPVNRLELFVTNYLSGLSFLVIPQIITFFISVIVCLANGITLIQYVLYAILIQMGVSFFAYSLAVFVAMFTGQLLAMPMYFFIINFLYVGCCFIVNAIIEMINFGVTDRWNPGKSCVLSPLYYLGNNLYVSSIYDKTVGGTIGLEFHGIHLVIGYAVVAVVITIIAYQFYRRRQIETAGDWVSVGFVKPVFRWGVAMCGGVLLSIWFTHVLANTHRINMYVCSVLLLIVCGFFCFFAAEMLLCKHFKVFNKKRVMEWAGFTVIAVLFITLFKMDAFGVERKVPDVAEIDTVFVYMDYPLQLDDDDVGQMIEIHKDIIAHKEEYLAIEAENQGYYYTTIRYYLKDGSTLERRYPLPVSEEYITDESTPTAQILAWESETENLKKQILGMNYTENDYISGYIDLYNESLEYRDVMFDKEQTAAIAEAVEKDIEAGKFASYYLDSVHEDDMDDRYYNNINLDYYNRCGYYDSWDYYSNYKNYGQDEEMFEEQVRSTSCNYIIFGPDCVNTVKVLTEQGIVDDTWKLWTNKEYNEHYE